MAFDRYARWYDAFNAGKDYRAEAAYLLALIAPWVPAPATWLDIGCGTGGHAAALADAGLAVDAVDPAAEMVAEARRRHPRLHVERADAETLPFAHRHDVTSMLFHVASYHAEEGRFARSLAAISARMKGDDLLLFDFWHSGGVLADPPGRRVRTVDIDGRRMTRIAVPREDRSTSRVWVHYEFRLDGEHGTLVHTEEHALRHFTTGEIEGAAAAAGLESLACWRWGSDRPLGDADWYGLACMRRGRGA